MAAFMSHDSKFLCLFVMISCIGVDCDKKEPAKETRELKMSIKYGDNSNLLAVTVVGTSK